MDLCTYFLNQAWKLGNKKALRKVSKLSLLPWNKEQLINLWDVCKEFYTYIENEPKCRSLKNAFSKLEREGR